MKTPVYDFAAIGIGPFNLGLAALTANIPQLKGIFFDTKPRFSWHPGMLLPFAKMQVPFSADLVTPADPTNRFGFLSYLKQHHRYYRFFVLEDNYITRREYLDYCSWVASQLSSLCFSSTVQTIRYLPDESLYAVEVTHAGSTQTHCARRLVIGVGSTPALPTGIQADPAHGIIHSAQYLEHKSMLQHGKSITIIGSGQSAAEIFYDLLSEASKESIQLNWYTRSDRFHPMETAKLTFELTSPEYIRYFHSLTPAEKALTLSRQQYLYKGINADLIGSIYRLLYEQAYKHAPVLQTGCELLDVVPGLPLNTLKFLHHPTRQVLTRESASIILATGYQQAPAEFLKGISERIGYESGNYKVNLNYTIDVNGKEIFVQNADLHSHGFNAPDLGMGPHRNSVIINTMLGYEHYPIEQNVSFQSFQPFVSTQ